MIWALESGGINQPETLWCGTVPGGVFVSNDNANTWEDVVSILPSKFGFATAVHPHDHNIAWFVPAINDEKRIPVDGKVVVARTRDGGKTFEVLQDGLPQESAYDLVFRHSLTVDKTGNRVAFGSTTGSVWISENQGEQWNLLSNHLPPICCAQFG